MTRKVALFAFNGESMCFVHAIINAIDLHKRGFDVKLIVEGNATKLIDDLDKKDNTFHELYDKAKSLGLIDCVCDACSMKMGTHEAAIEQGLNLCAEMYGHPSMGKYIEDGYDVITIG